MLWLEGRIVLVGMQLAAARRRVRGKSIPPLTPGEEAVAAEGWHDLVALDDDVRRHHIHWVHPIGTMFLIGTAPPFSTRLTVDSVL